MAAPSSTRSRRRPATKENKEPSAKRGGNGRRSAPRTRGERLRRRYAVVYDIDGPRVRLGIAWFFVAFIAIVFGPLTTAVVYGLAAASGAAQSARAWRRRRQRASRVVAPAMAGGLAVGACLGAGGAGLAVLGGTTAAVFVAVSDPKSRTPIVTDAGWTIQCALPVGLVAMSMVLLVRLDAPSALALLLLASAYETGDYIVGSGSRNPYEGPVAGIAAITVVTFIVSSFGVAAFDVTETWVYCAVVAVLAPLGQLFASAILPAAGAPASGLRRLDSLLLAAPVWWFAVERAL